MVTCYHTKLMSEGIRHRQKSSFPPHCSAAEKRITAKAADPARQAEYFRREDISKRVLWRVL